MPKHKRGDSKLLPVTSAAEIRQMAGPVTDHTIAAILNTEPSFEDLEVAAAYARGDGDTVDRLRSRHDRKGQRALRDSCRGRALRQQQQIAAAGRRACWPGAPPAALAGVVSRAALEDGDCSWASSPLASGAEVAGASAALDGRQQRPAVRTTATSLRWPLSQSSGKAPTDPFAIRLRATAGRRTRPVVWKNFSSSLPSTTNAGDVRLVHQCSLERRSLASKGARESLGIKGLREPIATLAVIFQKSYDIANQPNVPELAS